MGLLRGGSSSVSWKQISTHTKGHHGWKKLNKVSNEKEAIQEDSKWQKSKSIKRMQKEWEWEINEYVCPYSVMSLWCLSYKKPNA